MSSPSAHRNEIGPHRVRPYENEPSRSYRWRWQQVTLLADPRSEQPAVGAGRDELLSSAIDGTPLIS